MVIMGYNIFAQTDKKVNWEELNQKLMPIKLLEFIPMVAKGINGGDAIGISIPSKNCCVNAWEELKAAVVVLVDNYQFELYDMYYGEKIDEEMLYKIKKIIS